MRLRGRKEASSRMNLTDLMDLRFPEFHCPGSVGSFHFHPPFPLQPNTYFHSLIFAWQHLKSAIDRWIGGFPGDWPTLLRPLFLGHIDNNWSWVVENFPRTKPLYRTPLWQNVLPRAHSGRFFGFISSSLFFFFWILVLFNIGLMMMMTSHNLIPISKIQIHGDGALSIMAWWRVKAGWGRWWTLWSWPEMKIDNGSLRSEGGQWRSSGRKVEPSTATATHCP